MTPAALDALMERLGLSQIELARLLDVSDRAVRYWQEGERPIPRAVELLLLAMQHKDISPRTLARWREKMEDADP